MSNRRLEDVSLTCFLNHYILETSSKRLFDICRKHPIDVLQMSKHS